jgi:hypothetical protein
MIQARYNSEVKPVICEEQQQPAGHGLVAGPQIDARQVWLLMHRSVHRGERFGFSATQT